MNTFRLIVLALVLVLFSACAKIQPVGPAAEPGPKGPLSGLNFLPRSGDLLTGQGDRLTLEQLTVLAQGADYILIGESHRNTLDHAVQARIIEALAGSDTPPAIGLEMASVAQQPVLAQFEAGRVRLEELEESLDWKGNWGHPFALYRSIFALAEKYSLPVAGLNVPTALMKTVSEEGLEALTPEERKMFPARIVEQSREQESYLLEVMREHSGKDADNPQQVKRFFLAQSIWDSQMAEQAVALRTKYHWPVVVLAGSGHVEKGWGIARRIKFIDPTARILSISPLRLVREFETQESAAYYYSPAMRVSQMGYTLEVGEQGLLVVEVGRGTRADFAGLRPGDIVEMVNNDSVQVLFDLHKVGVKAHDQDQPLVFTVRRGGKLYTLDFGRLGEVEAR